MKGNCKYIKIAVATANECIPSLGGWASLLVEKELTIIKVDK
jgi:hypothetical protein